MTDYTKKLKQKKNIFLTFDTAVWLLYPLIMLILAFSHLHGGTNLLNIFSAPIKDVIMGFGITTAIALVGTIIIKDKMRTFLFMMALAISIALYGSVGMTISFIVWGIEEYILHNLYLHFKNKYTINKEIDKRE